MVRGYLHISLIVLSGILLTTYTSAKLARNDYSSIWGLFSFNFSFACSNSIYADQLTFQTP